MIAAELATLPRGNPLLPNASDEAFGTSRQDAADLMQASPGSVERAKRIIRYETSALTEVTKVRVLGRSPCGAQRKPR